MRLKPLFQLIGPALAGCVLLQNPAFSAQSAEDRERALEERILYLENRLNQIENRMSAASEPGGRKRPARKVAPGGPAAAGNVNAAPGSGGSAAGAPPAPKNGEPGRGAPDPAASPQESFIFRENAVTLKKGGFEISTEASYIHSNGFLQLDRALVSATSIRYGVADWIELGASLPLYYSTRSSAVGPSATVLREVKSLGDASLLLNARLFDQTPDLPGVVLNLGVISPTGKAPYNFAGYQPVPCGPVPAPGATATLATCNYKPNPTDSGSAYLSRGAWGGRAGLQFYKTLDPIVVFWGGGLEYLLKQHDFGHTIQQGARAYYNLGFSFALSDRSTLGFQINGAFQRKLRVDGLTVPESTSEPISARFSLVQRIARETWFEPSVTIGLTNNTPDLTLGAGVRRRF